MCHGGGLRFGDANLHLTVSGLSTPEISANPPLLCNLAAADTIRNGDHVINLDNIHLENAAAILRRPGRSGVVPSPGTGESGARARLASLTYVRCHFPLASLHKLKTLKMHLLRTDNWIAAIAEA
jgi:hypothetical protein